MGYARTVEAIQRDIIFLMNEKKGFFEGLFNSNEKRMEDLVKEEWEALSVWLYTVDKDYKRQSEDNIALLAGTHWQLKIVDCQNSRRRMCYTDSITGMIHTKGFLYGEGHTSYLIRPEKLPYAGNYLDALGKMQMQDIQAQLPAGAIPKIFHCYTNTQGIVSIETVDQDNNIFYKDPIIGHVTGDPFDGNSLKRTQFLRNRQSLLKTIRQHTVRASMNRF